MALVGGDGGGDGEKWRHNCRRSRQCDGDGGTRGEWWEDAARRGTAQRPSSLRAAGGLQRGRKFGAHSLCAWAVGERAWRCVANDGWLWHDSDMMVGVWLSGDRSRIIYKCVGDDLR